MYDQVVKCQRAGLCLSEHFLIKEMCYVMEEHLACEIPKGSPLEAVGRHGITWSN